MDFLGLSNLSNLNKEYVRNEIIKFIREINMAAYESQNKATIQPQLKFEGFKDNEKFREVEKLLNEIEVKQDAKPIDNPIQPGGNYEFSYSPSTQIDSSIESALIEKYGKDAMTMYNELTDEEKEYIIKCL